MADQTKRTSRKDPLRVRRRSTKEFSRVSSLLRAKMDSNTRKIEALEKRVKKLESNFPVKKLESKPESKPPKRKRKSKAEE